MKHRLTVSIALFFAALIIGRQEPLLARYAKCIPSAGEDTQLTQDVLKSMSPELRKKKLVFSDPGYLCNQLYTLYSIQSDGSNQKALTTEQASTKSPVWSSDGKTLLVVKGQAALYILKEDGTDPIKVFSTDSPNDSLFLPIWSPDGKQIAFLRGPYGAAQLKTFVINLDGTGLFEVPDSAGVYKHYLSWSPDSSQIVYTAKAMQGNYEIRLISRDGVEFSTLIDGQQPNWSPDGQHIAFVTNKLVDGALRGSLMVIAPDGSGLKEIFVAKPDQYVYTPVWSPKGTYIAFGVASPALDHLKGNYDIVIIDADGSNPRSINDHQRKISSRLQDISDPNWSFDEAFIVCELSRDDGFNGTHDIGLTEVSTFKSTVWLQNALSASWQP